MQLLNTTLGMLNKLTDETFRHSDYFPHEEKKRTVNSH